MPFGSLQTTIAHYSQGLAGHLRHFGHALDDRLDKRPGPVIDLMPFGRSDGVVAGRFGSAFFVFPGRRLEGAVDASRLAQWHQRRSALGVAENQELFRARRQAVFRGVSAMVDAAEPSSWSQSPTCVTGSAQAVEIKLLSWMKPIANRVEK
ncbi:hypothetical protein [Nitratireductor soli]|uniref:hypothetical protein n=1 Tax=Nitratireductor soli TaxID=1670619 RepID=UPI00065DDAFD|nr:hypothetical protein [Nitratireductor soli]